MTREQTTARRRPKPPRRHGVVPSVEPRDGAPDEPSPEQPGAVLERVSERLLAEVAERFQPRPGPPPAGDP
jgi:hypothetical protein